MIEQAIYFALGCIVTALLGLLFTPVLWSRALRLSRKRLQLQVPLSLQEILSERDHLRAAHAVERLRIEQELARVRATKDADMIAIGRRSVEAARLAEEVEAFRKLVEAQTREIALLSAAAAEHKVESSMLRRDLIAAHTSVEQLRGEADTAAREHARLAEEGEGRGTSAEAPVARVSDDEGAQATIRHLQEELAAVRGERDKDRERQKEFHLGNSLKAEKGRAADRAAADRLERLEAENVALKRTIEARETRGGPSERAPDDAGLRESIHALGLVVATMSRDKRERNVEWGHPGEPGDGGSPVVKARFAPVALVQQFWRSTRKRT